MEPYLTEALSRAEIPEALLLLGVLREREGRFREALHLLERAAFRGEGEVAGMAYHHLAQVKRALRRPLKEVLGDHKRAHALRAYPAPYLFRLAQEALEGEEVLARELLSRARDAGLEAVAEEDLTGLIHLLERLEGPWAAFSVLYQALSRTPQPPLELLALAYRLSRAFRESPEAETARGQYLAALYAAGRAEEVGRLLEEELKAHPQALEVLLTWRSITRPRGTGAGRRSSGRRPWRWPFIGRRTWPWPGRSSGTSSSSGRTTRAWPSTWRS